VKQKGFADLKSLWSAPEERVRSKCMETSIEKAKLQRWTELNAGSLITSSKVQMSDPGWMVCHSTKNVGVRMNAGVDLARS
jgi:hypothetical protein